MVIDATQTRFSATAEWITKMAHRRAGVGFDQLLVIEPPPDSDVEFGLGIYNSDGGEAKQCGNGSACVARYLKENHMLEDASVSLRSQGGFLRATILDTDSDGNDMVELSLSEPELEPSQVPFLTSEQDASYDLELLEESAGVVNLTPVSIGNPHAVVFDVGLDDFRIPIIGQAVQQNDHFPESANVEFVEVVDRDRLQIRIIERGAGETSACGSGSCAATVAAQLRNLVDQTVTVSQPGGEAIVKWQGPSNPIYLTVPATHVYSGVVSID